MAFPVYTSYISAGFPSPAEDHVDQFLDLHEYLVQNPAATFFVRVQGDSMTNAGINSGDLLIIDRSIDPMNGNIVIAAVAGELTVKRFQKQGRKVTLKAENPDYPSINVDEYSDLTIWGVVTTVIHPV